MKIFKNYQYETFPNICLFLFFLIFFRLTLSVLLIKYKYENNVFFYLKDFYYLSLEKIKIASVFKNKNNV